MGEAMRLRTQAPLLRPDRRPIPRPLIARAPSLHSVALEHQRTRGNVATQRLLQRQPTLQANPKWKIDYKRAERRNQSYAKSLKWAARLAQLQPTWDEAWKKSDSRKFAELVADFQLGQSGLEPDGELGPATWSRLRPIGEVISERAVSWEDSESVCSTATHERLLEGYSQATGKQLVGKAQAAAFRIILHSISSEMAKVDEQYRATGAAGALVYLGKGTFVTQDEIWKDKALLPGAAMQVWKKKSDVERIKQSKEPKHMGTSFVFVEYVGDDAMKVKHYDQLQTHKKTWYEFWVGANINR
jgi:hypothetical protein